ncbi:hypothetical protein ACEG19_03945 [Blautia stercoris]|uniref:hypothetical protein n=1 Tax=Blautia stercoris TaxID=871664 RepID=UPI00355C3E7A
MQKAVMTFRELLTLLSPIQHIEVDTQEDDLENVSLFDGSVAMAKREEALLKREVRLITLSGKKMKVWLYE